MHAIAKSATQTPNPIPAESAHWLQLGGLQAWRLRARTLLPIVQGGMGVAVSSWQLAREVSRCGQLGVVSGTALDGVLARELQDGDPGGHRRRALAHFPSQAMAQRVLDTRRHHATGAVDHLHGQIR